jgi:hypothetical protein
MALSHDRNDVGRRTWSARPALDPSLRRSIYGPIRPMDPPGTPPGALPGILQRLFGRH